MGIVFYRESSSEVVVSDYNNFCLRHINVTSGAVTTLSPCFTAGMEDGPLSSAKFCGLYAFTRPAWSSFGYLADVGNNRIRRIDLDAGVVATVVGSGTAGWQGSESSVTALIDQLRAVAFGCRGGFLTMYVSGYHAIATVDMSKTADIGTCRPTAVNIGPVTLLAGRGAVNGSADGPALVASFRTPQSVVRIRHSSSLIILDEMNYVLRRFSFTTNSTVDTWVGAMGQAGSVPLAGRDARIAAPRCAIIHPRNDSQIIVATSETLIVVEYFTAQVTILSGRRGIGYAEGAASVAQFNWPAGLIADPNMLDLILADTGNFRLRRVSLFDGWTALVVGSAPRSVDGTASTACIHGPVGLTRLPRAVPSDRLFVGDHYGNCIRAVSLTDYVVTSLTPCGDSGKRDGALRTARFSGPGGFTAVPASWAVGAFLVAELTGHRIRMVDIAAGGWVTTVVGTGTPSWRPSPVSSLEVQLNRPTLMTFDLSAPNNLLLYIGFSSSVACVKIFSTLHRETGTVTRLVSGTLSMEPTGSRTRPTTRSVTFSRIPSTVTRTRGPNPRASVHSLTRPASAGGHHSVTPTNREVVRGAFSETLTSLPEKDHTSAFDAGRSPVVPTTARVAVSAVAAVGAAVVGLVGLPVASRPAVVGAAVRMATCVADGATGPEVPPYEAMPARFAVLGTPAATAGSAVTSNAAVVVLCIVGAYAASGNAKTDTLSDGNTDSQIETSMRASMAHAAATVPFSYIAPALVEFSVMWLSAAATPGSTFALGSWAAGFVVGLAVAFASWALLTWRGHAVAVAVHDANGTGGSDGRWVTLVGPLIAATRDVASPRVRYAFFVEVGTGLLFSALSGIRVESLCVAKCIAATLVALAFLGYLLVVQPAAERMDNWFGVGFAALQALTGALLTAAVLQGRGRGGQDESSSSTWPGTAVDVAECVSVATLVLLVVQAVVGLIIATRNASSRRTDAHAHPDRPTLDQGLLKVPVSEAPVGLIVAARHEYGRSADAKDQWHLTVPVAKTSASNDAAGSLDRPTLQNHITGKDKDATQPVARLTNPLVRR
jgi:hypothetical protein